MPEASFLDHRIIRDGVAPEPDKLTKLDDWQTLCNTKKMQRFLEFAAGGGVLFLILPVFPSHWLGYLKRLCMLSILNPISSALLLRHSDHNKEFVVTTDTSVVGIGGTLRQRDELCTLSPFAWFSRVLSKSERAYSTFDREALVIRNTLLHLRYYLLGVKFLLQTDHLPLLQDLFGRRGRWFSEIEEFNFEIEHIEGKENFLADALSRLRFDKSIEDRSSNSSVATITANNSSDPAVPMTVLANWPWYEEGSKWMFQHG